MQSWEDEWQSAAIGALGDIAKLCKEAQETTEQKILDVIAAAEKSLHNKPDQMFLMALDADTLQSLKNDIKQLCQKEMKQ